MVREKVREKSLSLFFKARELSGIFDISQGIFQFKPKQDILKTGL